EAIELFEPVATVVELPAVGDADAVGVALAEVVAVGLALGRQLVDPHGAALVVIGERGDGEVGAARAGALAGAVDRRRDGGHGGPQATGAPGSGVGRSLR